MIQQLRILACLAVMGVAAPAQAQDQTQDQEQRPDIKNFISHIWQSNPALAKAEAKVSAAQAAQKAASRWQYNPELEYEYQDADGEDKTNLLGINQTIDWSGKFLSSGKTAEFELKATEAERDEIRQNTAVDVLSALANYRAARDIFDLAAQRSIFMKSFAELAKKSFKAGDIDQSEYNLAQLAFSEALIEQADSETTLAIGKQELNSSIGFPLGNNFTLPDLPNALPSIASLGQTEEEMLINLPPIRAMKNREGAAKSAITQARKNRLPDPSIGLVAGKDSGADMIGFSVSVPLHVFNTYGAEVDQAKQEAIAEAKAGQNALYIAQERLQSSHRSYQLSRKAWINWQENGAQALAKQADILDRKFKVGDLSATDYLVQIEQALDTEVAAKELHSKVWQSWFAWLAASGSVEQWIQNLGE